MYKNYKGPLRPYKKTPQKKVADTIKKPDYANHPKGKSASEEKKQSSNVIPIYSEEQIEGIRQACIIGRKILDEAHKLCKPGVKTDEIDCLVHELCIQNEAYPSPLNYYNFPKSVCT